MTPKAVRELCEDLEAAVSDNLRGGKKGKFVLTQSEWGYLSLEQQMDFEDFVVDLARELGPGWLVQVGNDQSPKSRLFRMVISWRKRPTIKGERE